MTTGDPIRRIIKFFIPVLLGNLLQQLYGMADSFIVSRVIGVEAFSGVSATGALNFLILGFALGACSGFAIPVSQEFGAGDYSMMRRCFVNSLYACAAISAIMAITTGILTPQILRLVGTPDKIFGYSQAYMRIIFMGIPATMLYNLMAGVMRAVGDGRTPLYMLIFSCLLNVALDIVCVVPLDMGVAGAAVATIASQLVSGLLCIWVIYRKFDLLKIRRDERLANWSVLKRVLGMGLPMGLQFSITAIGSTILQRAVNALGWEVVGALGAGGKVQFFFTTPMEATGVTMATYCGQNLGAGKIERVRVGVKRITIIFAAYSAAALGMQMLFGKYMLMMFLKPEESDILANALTYMNTVMIYIFLLALVLIYRNAIQGLGYSRVAMLAGLLELIGRAFVALVLVDKYGFEGACYAHPLAWLCADALLIPLYFTIVRKYERMPLKNRIRRV